MKADSHVASTSAQTVACVVSGTTRAAIAVIAVRGHYATTAVTQHFTPAGPRAYQANEIRYGSWHGKDTTQAAGSTAAESVVVVPLVIASTTEPEHWEIHCHGGSAAANRILTDLRQSHVTVVDQTTWLSLQGESLLAREIQQAFTDASTTRTAGILFQQRTRGLPQFLEQAFVLLASDDEQSVTRLRDLAQRSLNHAKFGLHLTMPWKVTLAGRPNVGKSSLMNALVGYQRSITYNQPGTTRDTLMADAVIEGWPIQFSDTAGLRESVFDPIEREGIQRATANAASADLLLWVCDASAPDEQDQPPTSAHHVPMLRVWNKLDQATESGRALITQQNELATVATTGAGIDSLRQAIVGRLIPELPSATIPLPLRQRHVDLLQTVVAADDPRVLGEVLLRLRDGEPDLLPNGLFG